MAAPKKYTAKDGTETWRVRYRLQGRSCSKTFADERSAEVFGEMVDRWGIVQALEFIREPTTPRGGRVTVAECVERYAALRQPVTRKLYRTMARLNINPVLGEMPIGKLTPETVQLWANSLTGSTSTIHLTHSILYGSLVLAMSRGEIDSNPARKVSKSNPTGIRLPRTRATKEPVFLSRDEYALLLKATPEHYQPLIEFLTNSGCRIGEALALTPADINMRTGKVQFNKTFSVDEHGNFAIGTTKTESSDREVAVPRRVLDQLDLSNEFVFTSPLGNRINRHTFYRRAWKKALKDSGLPAHRQPRIHDLRHTHASWLLDAGISIHAVKERLGHADVMTTLRIYGHAAADSEDRILNVLS